MNTNFMSKPNLDTLLIKNLDTLQELDEKTAEAVSGGTDWICMWPDDPTGAYWPQGVGAGLSPLNGTWHYADYTRQTWVNTWNSCYPVGIIATT